MIIPNNLLLVLLSLIALCQNETYAQLISVADLVGHEAANVEAKFPRVDNARTIFQSALTLTGQPRLQRLRQALTQLQDACKEDPQLPPASIMWAKLLFSAGESNSAQTELEHSTIESPQEPEGFVLLGELSVATGRLAEAKLTFDQGASLLKAWPTNHLRRTQLQARIAAGLANVLDAQAEVLLTKGLKERAEPLRAEAEKQLKSWGALDTTNSAAFDRLGGHYLRRDMYDQARAQFLLARELNANLPVPDVRLGRFAQQQGKKELAATYMKAAASQHAKDAAVLTAVADWSLATGNLTEARQHLKAALAVAPDDMRANLLLAQAERFDSKWKEAAALLDKLQSRHPAEFEVSNLLAVSLAELPEARSRERALELAAVNAQRFNDLKNPIGMRASLVLAWVQSRQDQTQPAQAQLLRLLSAGLNTSALNGDEAYFLAKLSSDFGNKDVALPVLQQTLASDVAFPYRRKADELLLQLK